MNERFDPRRHLVRLRGGEYLEVKWRLVWFRNDHPEASIVTDLVHFSDEYAVVRATVRTRDGAEATGFGMERSSEFGDYLEKAETKAIGRALAALGYGTAFAVEFGDPFPTEDTNEHASVANQIETEQRQAVLERGMRVLQRMRERERDQGVPVSSQLEFLVGKGYLGTYIGKRLRERKASERELTAALGTLNDEQLRALAAYCEQHARTG